MQSGRKCAQKELWRGQWQTAWSQTCLGTLARESMRLGLSEGRRPEVGQRNWGLNVGIEPVEVMRGEGSAAIQGV